MAFRTRGWYRDRWMEWFNGSLNSASAPAAADVSQHLERLIRRDRLIAACAVAILTLFAWMYLGRMAVAMRAAATEAEMHAAMGMTGMDAWRPGDIASLFVMWIVMMAGMMLPSAAPMILLVASTHRRQGGPRARIRTAAGYPSVSVTAFRQK